MSLVDSRGRPIESAVPKVRVLVDRTDPDFRPPLESEPAAVFFKGPVPERAELPAGVRFYFDREAEAWTIWDEELPTGWRIVGWSRDQETAVAGLENYLSHLERNRSRITTRHRIENRLH